MGVAACPDRPSRHGRGTQKSAVSAAFAGKKDGSLMEARFSPEWHFAMADLFRLFFFFASRFYVAAVERRLQVRVLLYRPGRLRFVFSSWASGVFRGPQANKKGADLPIGALLMADGGKGGI